MINLRHTILLIVSFLCVFLLWEIFVVFFKVNQTLFPPLHVVLAAYKDSTELVSDIGVSLYRLFVGTFFGALCGVLFGLMTSRIQYIHETIGQVATFFRFIPPLALVPLFLLWFGIGEFSKISLILWTTFFPVWLNTHHSIQSIEKNYLLAAKSLQVKRLYFIKNILLQGSLPTIFQGVRIGIGFAFSVLIAAEMIGAYAGLGHRIFFLQSVYRTDRMLGYILVLGLLGLIVDKVFIVITKKITPWKNGI